MDMNELPENCLGADLVWWRTSNGMRTTVSLLWALYHEFPEPVYLQAKLFDCHGKLSTTWNLDINPQDPLFIDSSADGPWGEYRGSDGILALYVITKDKPQSETSKRYSRLFPYVDWHLADGRNACLHSDQVVIRGNNKLQRITEIVVLENDIETNALIVLNGEEEQDSGVLSLSFKNHLGHEKTIVCEQVMRPFTVLRIPFRDCFPDIVGFADNKALQVSGSFLSRGLFSRPFLETTGQRWGLYHTGDVYRWKEKPYFVHALIGGEVNPMAVIVDEHVNTSVNLLHSHDGFEEDVSIDVKLYDESGSIVFNQAAWCQLARHGLVRFDISDFLQDSRRPFRGHIALSFSVERDRSVPIHLQALLEYRHADSIAHVMAWSDEWNSKHQLAKRDRASSAIIKKAFNRIHCNDELDTELAITNAGHDGYQRDAMATITLLGNGYKSDAVQIFLAPYASRFVSISELFPEAHRILAPSGLGVVIIESESELATVAFTRLRSTGAIAAEHFIKINKASLF